MLTMAGTFMITRNPRSSFARIDPFLALRAIRRGNLRDQQMADLLACHHDAVQRLAEVPGLGVDSAQQIIAEVGASAAAFPSAKQLASWMGACPGNEESAGVNYSHRCPKGNRQMRRVLNQAANAAVKAKGTIFAIVYRRLVPRPRPRASHRCHCSPALSSHLEDSSPRHSVRGTRTSG